MTKTTRILSDLASQIIKAITTKRQPNCCLLSGDMGMISFLYHYSMAHPDVTGIADKYLDEILCNLSCVGATYCNGLAGFGVGLKLLSDNGFIDMEEDVFSQIDSIIYPHFTQSLNNENIDFLHGASGMVYYAILCSPCPEKFIEPFKSWLLANRIPYMNSNDSFSLNFKLTATKTRRNISMSHGMSSIVAILAKAFKLTPHDNSIHDLLIGFVNYLLAQKMEPAILGSCTPSSPLDSGLQPHMSRLAWCYGDLGVACALLQASEILNDDHLLNEANLIFDFNCSREGYLNTYLVDTPICHGVAGVAQIYSSLIHRDKRWSSPAQKWRDRLVNRAIDFKGMYTFFHYDADIDGYVVRDSLLDGIAGVGMVLLDTPESNRFLNKILLLE